MAEVSKDAMLLITISWQALKRAELNNRATILCDTTVLMLFASIYIEANLNYIIDKMGMTDEMRKFYGKKEGNFRPGLQQKLVWFYNKFVARKKENKYSYKNFKKIEKKLWRKFPGYKKIYQFRNEISHGFVTRSIGNLDQAINLRQQAKDIVSELINIAKRKDPNIKQDINYLKVIESHTISSKDTPNLPDRYINLVVSSS